MKATCFIVRGSGSENNLFDSYVFYNVEDAKRRMLAMAENEKEFQLREWQEDFETIREDEYSTLVRGINRKDTWMRFEIEETTIE